MPTSIFINNNNLNCNDPSLISLINRVTCQDKIPAIKYLGVFFDPNLNFKFHVQQISSKMSKALFFLRSSKNFLPPSALKTLYYSLMHCHLTYAVEIWGCSANSTLTNIYLKQKAALRIICNKKYNAHTEPLFKKLEILPLFKLIEFSKIKFMHSYVFNFLPTSFDNIWILNRARYQNQDQDEDNINRILRNENDFFIPFVRTDFISNFPLCHLPKLWNNLPLELKNVRSKTAFHLQLKEHFLNQLEENYICTRLLCPACIH